MSEKMFGGNLAVDGVEMLVHVVGSPDGLFLAVTARKRELFL
jgi:hypothetical protein